MTKQTDPVARGEASDQARAASERVQSPPPDWVPPSTVVPPTLNDLRRAARRFRLGLSDADLDDYGALMEGLL